MSKETDLTSQETCRRINNKEYETQGIESSNTLGFFNRERKRETKEQASMNK